MQKQNIGIVIRRNCLVCITSLCFFHLSFQAVFFLFTRRKCFQYFTLQSKPSKLVVLCYYFTSFFLFPCFCCCWCNNSNRARHKQKSKRYEQPWARSFQFKRDQFPYEHLSGSSCRFCVVFITATEAPVEVALNACVYLVVATEYSNSESRAK